MTKQAEAHSEEDTKKKELVDAKNSADALIFTAEKSLKDAGDKVSEDAKKDIEEKIKVLREATSKDDKEDIESKTRELSDALSKIGEAMYKGSETGENSAKSEGSDNSEDQKEEGSAEEKKEDSKAKKGEAEEGEVVN